MVRRCKTREQKTERYPSSECHSQIFSPKNIVSGGILSGAIKKKRKKEILPNIIYQQNFRGAVCLHRWLLTSVCLFLLIVSFGCSLFTSSKECGWGMEDIRCLQNWCWNAKWINWLTVKWPYCKQSAGEQRCCASLQTGFWGNVCSSQQCAVATCMPEMLGQWRAQKSDWSTLNI